MATTLEFICKNSNLLFEPGDRSMQGVTSQQGDKETKS